jgi:hypothetical protein
MNLNLTSHAGQPCGIFKDMSDTEYHGNKEFWGSSMLRQLYRNSKKFKNPEPPSPAMIFGTNFHCFLLQNDLFNKQYIITDKSQRGKMTIPQYEAEKQKEADELGKRIIDISDIKQMEEMRVSLFAWRKNGYYPVQKWIEFNDPEVSYLIKDFNGLPVKIRPDILIDKLGWLGDLKVTSNASEDAFKRKIKEFDYDMQMAFYNDVYTEITGKKLKKLFWLVIEDKKPYSINTFEINLEVAELDTQSEDAKILESGRLGYMLCMEKAKSAISYDGYLDSIPDGKYFNKLAWNDWDSKRWAK